MTFFPENALSARVPSLLKYRSSVTTRSQVSHAPQGPRQRVA